jgi:hypothetical protein
MSFTDPSGQYCQEEPPPGQPGGQAQQPPDPCAACKKAIAALPAQIQPANKKGNCDLKGTCAKDKCPGGFYASTEYAPPVQGAAPVITICVSCQITEQSLDNVIAHERLHAKRFCTGRRGIFNTCKDCKVQEKAAYEESCKTLDPKQGKKYDKCVDCGVAYGCASYPPPSPKAKKCTDPAALGCAYSDIGLGIKPQPQQPQQPPAQRAQAPVQTPQLGGASTITIF